MGKTVPVDKSELNPQLYELLKHDVQNIRKKQGKGFTGKCRDMVIRQDVRWNLTSYSEDPDDFTIERYIHRFEHYGR